MGYFQMKRKVILEQTLNKMANKTTLLQQSKTLAANNSSTEHHTSKVLVFLRRIALISARSSI